MLPSFRVLEGSSATVNVYGAVDALELTRLAEVSGDGFLDASHDIALSSAVPEPSGTILITSGLAITMIVARRRRTS